VDRELLVVVGLVALAFFFVLPPWTPVSPSIKIESATLEDSTVSFSVSYEAPWRKSCFLVFYGPFRYDKPGHEAGNNIYVLTERTGTISDTLALRIGDTIDRLHVELWCDNNKLAEAEYPLTSP